MKKSGSVTEYGVETWELPAQYLTWVIST